MFEPFITVGPPTAYVDLNMTEEDGLVPAAVEFISGLLTGALVTGQEIYAKDEDGQIFIGEIARTEGALLFLRLRPMPTWTTQPIAGWFGATQSTASQPGPDLQVTHGADLVLERR